jgi:transposase
MKARPKEWTEAEKQALIRLVRDGAPMREITAKLKRHAGSVRRMALTMNLVIKGHGEAAN